VFSTFTNDATLRAGEAVKTDGESVGVPVKLPSRQSDKGNPRRYNAFDLVADFLSIELDKLEPSVNVSFVASRDSGAEETDAFRVFGDVVHLRADNGVKRPDHLHAPRVKALCEPPLFSLGVEGGDQILMDHSVRETSQFRYSGMCKSQ
jgi:hypothetical protein